MKKPIPFGKYYLLDRISVGGMAEVFKAKAFGVEGFERLIAVKRILPSIAEDEEFITMFIDEAKIAVQLQHANIAQIFDLGKVGDSYFIALEYVSGKDVRTIFDRLRRIGQSIPIPMVAYITMKVCEGLDYAHNKKDAAHRDLNLVHRDVSPQNILISYDGEIKLIDFGIAKAAGKAGKTQAGILKGKFGYMSPEQVRGLPLDRRSDIFALGICMWEMITGERLFIGESDFSTLEKVRNVEITPPSSYNRRLPEDLENIILRALSKEVEDRYQTAMDLHDDLQSWMYTSGNFFARKDLASFMTKLFKGDIEKEVASNEGGLELSSSTVPPPPKGLKPTSGRKPLRPGAPPLPPRRSQAPPLPRASGSDQVPRPPTGEYPVQPPGPTAAGRMSQPQVAKITGSSPPIPPIPKRTIMGMPGPSASLPDGAGAQAAQALAPSPGLPAGMVGAEVIQPAPSEFDGAIPLDDWDDDEPPTNIYSKKEAAEMARAAVAQETGGAAAVVSAPPGIGAVPVPALADTREISQEEARPYDRGPLVKVVVAAAVAVVLIVAVLLFILLPPKTGTLILNVEPQDQLRVVVDGSSILPGTQSPFRIELKPGEHNITINRNGITERTAVTIEKGEEFVKTVNLKAAVSGFFLETDPPGASVWIDDRPMDQKTPATFDDLEPGKHIVRIAKGELYDQINLEVEVIQGEITQLPPKKLELKEVELEFKTTPDRAKVVVKCQGEREKSVGNTPVTVKIETSKECEVTYKKDGYLDVTNRIEYPAGQEKVVLAEVILRRSGSGGGPRRPPRGDDDDTGSGAGGRRTGTLSVQTRPWSKVYVDGRFIKNTPLVNYELKAGKHKVTVKNPSYNITKTFTVIIKPGKTNTLVKTLI